MAKSKVVRVEAFPCAGTIVISIEREYSNGLKTERTYNRSQFRTHPLSLPRCLYLGILRGNTFVRPWLSHDLGWAAEAKPFY